MATPEFDSPNEAGEADRPVGPARARAVEPEDFLELLDTDPWLRDITEQYHAAERLAAECRGDQRASAAVTRYVTEARRALNQARLTREAELYEALVAAATDVPE